METFSPARRVILRQATLSDHDRLDRLVSGLDLASADGYLALLQLHAAILLPAERWLEGCSIASELPDWPQRARSAALLADLASFGVAPAAERSLVFADSRAARAGVVYVLEGSRIGGRVLLARVKQAAGDFPTAFLEQGQGEKLWSGFLSWLEALPPAPDFSAAMTASARQVFGHYEDEARRRFGGQTKAGI